MDGMLSLPTLFDPRVEATSEVGCAGARIWASERDAPGCSELLPDLSFDIVLADGRVFSSPRTTRVTEVPAPAGIVAGVRLPIASGAPRIDPDWRGWRHRPRDRATATELLASAIAAGAVRWRVDAEVVALLHAADRPGLRGDELADVLGMSERTMRRRTLARLGMPPSRLARILRLWRFLAASRSGSLAEAAAVAGYADQAHATREARALAGTTPARLARLDVAGSFKTPQE